MGFSIISIYLSKSGLRWVSFTSLFLFPSWLLGTWIASLHRGNKIMNLKVLHISSMAIFFLIIALVSRLQKWEEWTQYSCWTGFYLAFFIFVLRFEKSIHKLRKNIFFKSLAWLGKISFSLYLVHFPLFKLLGYLHVQNFGHKPVNFLVTLAYLIPVCFVAWIFYRLIEFPSHQFSKKMIK